MYVSLEPNDSLPSRQTDLEELDRIVDEVGTQECVSRASTNDVDVDVVGSSDKYTLTEEKRQWNPGKIDRNARACHLKEWNSHLFAPVSHYDKLHSVFDDNRALTDLIDSPPCATSDAAMRSSSRWLLAFEADFRQITGERSLQLTRVS